MLFPSSFKTVIGAQQGVQIQQEKNVFKSNIDWERNEKENIREVLTESEERASTYY